MLGYDGRDLLASLAGLVPGLIYQLRLCPDGRSSLPYASPGIWEMFELTSEEVREDAAPVFGRLHPDDHYRVVTAMGDSATTLAPFNCDFRVVLPGQGLRWRAAQAHPERLDDGSTLWHGIISDTTGRILADEELRPSEERFRQVVSNATFPLMLYADDGAVLAISDSWTGVSGYSLGDIPTIEAWTRLALGDRMASVNEMMRRVFRAPQVVNQSVAQGTLIVRTRTGDTRSWEFYAAPLGAIPDGRHLALSMAVDVTERERIEETLRLDTEIMHAMRDAVLLVRAEDGVIVHADTQTEVLFGYSLAELLGLPVSALYSPVEEVPELRAAKIIAAVRKGGIWSGEIRSVRKNGERFWCSIAATGLMHRVEGQVVVCVQRDITEQKRIAVENAALEEHLLHAQKMENIGRLAGGLAHDFNNLLTVINGYCSLILDGLDPADPLAGYLTEMSTAGAQAADLTRQLLAISRKQIVERVALDLNQTIRAAAPLLRRLIGADVELVVNLQASGTPIRADHGQIHQVIMNLVVNSRDAMPDGGKLHIGTADLTLSEAAAAALAPEASAGHFALLTVEDTGLGMDEATLRHMFEPLFTTKAVGKGTGLGLATVSGIVRQCGGWITVRSEVGKGTLFTLCFPQIPAALPLAQTAPTPRPEAYEGGETILLAEDQESVRSFTRTVLGKLGYTVLTAADGEQAIQLAARHPGPIHLLLTDVVLPGMNGKMIFERLLVLRPEMKVIFLSGYTAEVIAERGLLEAGLTFVQKPFSPGALALKIRQVLDNGKVAPAVTE